MKDFNVPQNARFSSGDICFEVETLDGAVETCWKTPLNKHELFGPVKTLANKVIFQNLPECPEDAVSACLEDAGSFLPRNNMPVPPGKVALSVVV